MSVRVVALLAAVSASVLAQPTSTSPLDPPSNGMRRADPSWHALVNATVHVSPSSTLEHATVVVRDGRIVSVTAAPAPGGDGSAPKAPAGPEGARVWDCSGLHVYPAFIDPYVEVDAPRPGKDAPGRHWNGNVTPERKAIDGLLTEQAAKELRDIGFGAAGISPRGGIFRGMASVVSLAERDADASSAKPAVYAADVYEAVAFETGGGGESTAWPSYPGSQMGAIALMRQTLIDADWQTDARAAGAYSGPGNSLDALDRQRTTGPAWWMTKERSSTAGGLPLVFDCADELDVLRAEKIAKEFGRAAVMLGSGLEFRRLAGMAGTVKRPFILPVSYPEAPKMTSVSEADAIELREMMTWEQAPTNLRRLREAGVEIALTTSKLRGKGRFWENVRTAIRHGLSPADAMGMVTTEPARLMGVADQVGEVSVGRRANLTVTDADWFDAEVAKAEGKKPKIREVWVDGQRHEVTAAPGMKIEGVWDVAITSPPPAPPGAAEGKMKLTFSFDEDNKLTITKLAVGEDGKVKEDKVKPKEQRLEKNRLSFTFEHEPFGEPGVFITQGVVEGDEIYGDFIRSSGARMTFSAKKRPAPVGIGEWRVVEFDGKAKIAGARDQVRLSITRDAVKLVFTDEAGKRTVIKGEDVKVGADEKKQMAPLAAAVPAEGEKPAEKEEKEPMGFAASFKHDMEKLGGKGKSSDTLIADPADANVLIGEAVLPKEEGQAEASKHAYKLRRMTEAEIAAEKRAGIPRGMTGTWRVTLVDDDPKLVGSKPEEAKLIIVDEKGSVMLKGHASDGKAIEMSTRTAKVTDGSIAYEVDMGQMDPAQQGKVVKAEARRLGELLIGTMLAPDGSAHTWKAARVANWGDEPGDDDGEILEIAAVPEGITYPFGPYGSAEPPKQQSVVVKNATIWTSGPAGTIKNGTLVVSNGKVQMVGADVAVKMPEGTMVIDAQGKHVTAGLIDCHSHTGISRGVNEGGQAVTAEVRIGDVTNPDSISWYRQLAGGITAVNNLHGSANPIGGQNQVNKNRWGATLPDDLHFEGAIPGIKFALGENVKQGNGDRVVTRYPRSRMGVETLIRDRFTAAKEYIGQRQKKGFHRDLELEALAEILEGKRLVHCHSYRQDEIFMLCRLANEFGFKIGTFQHILEGYKVADELAKHGGASGFSDWWAYKIEVQDAIPQGGPIMYEQGVLVSYNSDSDEMARRMNVEAGKAIKYSGGVDGKPGIAPEEALKFVTLNPAKQLHIDSKVGSLEVGKDGDFVIWSGEPLSTMSRAEQTWIDGRCYFSLEKDKALRERIAGQRARLTQKILGGKKDGQKEADAKAEASTPGDQPAGQGRRRRRPEDDAGGGLGSGADDTLAPDRAPTDWYMRKYYYERYMRGLPIDAALAGECGCYGN